MQNIINVFEDPLKISILELLDKKSSISAGDITRELKSSPSYIIDKLLELKDIGLVKKTVNPLNYNLNKQLYEKAKKHLSELSN
ncbi:MAG: hypothetical protein C0594_09450 [Marinilabiliales bacterium]|nr:MAG: hypothetical protein C0594_09450 [Marinilabiliales bacterium]